MKKKRIIVLCLLAIAIVLELLPYGAVLIFGNPDGTRNRETFSYFDLRPYGYANFAPLITAILTSVLLFMFVVYMFNNNAELYKKIKGVSIAAVIVSFMPLLRGLENYSVTGFAISVVLLVVCIVLQLKGFNRLCR
ncbi:MAG: hypothetical protein E7261_11230 [Lachnospiraceae bacterium]|nr:hypothetical protein [Lachnospiraceae bacterium]